MLKNMANKYLAAVVVIFFNGVLFVDSKCSIPNGFDNARLLTDIGNQTEFENEHALKYECNLGYRPVIGLRVSVCDPDGQWSEIQCVLKLCKWLPNPENGKRLDSNSVAATRTRFECDPGYLLVGHKSLLCRTDGKWRPSQPPHCEPVSCGPLPGLANGYAFQKSLDGRRNIFDRVVSFTCDRGYDLKQGSSRRRCQADGTWSGTQPVCATPSCSDLDPPIQNGVEYHENDDIHLIGHFVTVKCNEGADLFPEDFDGMAMCEDEDTWEVSNIACERRVNVSPTSNMRLYKGKTRNSSNRVWVSMAAKSRTWLYFECEDEYELLDRQTGVYYEEASVPVKVLDGTLTPGLPACKEERCSLVEDSCTYTDTDGDELTGKVEHDTVVVKTCHSDYEFEPENKRTEPNVKTTCNQGSIPFPKCVLKRCVMPSDRDANEEGWRRKLYSSGDLVLSEETVQKSCQPKRELYLPGSRLYPESFKSTCRVGVWSKPEFPVCRQARCQLERDSCSYKDIDDNELTGKVEHGTTVVKTCDPDNEFELNNRRRDPSFSSTCDQGTIAFPKCILKRCEIPQGRKAKWGKTYNAGDLVSSADKVQKICGDKEEMYFPDTKTYAEPSTRFMSNCKVGVWSNPHFPICKEARCQLERDSCSYKDIDDNELTGKVEHGTTVVKTCDPDYEFELNNRRRDPSFSSTCDQGTIAFPKCILKRCEIPQGRKAKWGKTYNAGDLVSSKDKVQKTCGDKEEMYFPDTKTYAEPSTRFISNCKVGVWSNPHFPICKEARCLAPVRIPATHFLLDKQEVVADSRLEHGTILTKSCDVDYEDTNDAQTECDRGIWIDAEACTPKPCHLPVVENSKRNEQAHIIHHNKSQVLECKDKYKLAVSGHEVEEGQVAISCSFGKLKPILDEPKCVPKGCSSIQNADSYKTNETGAVEKDPTTYFDHTEQASMQCKDNFILIDKDWKVVDEEGMVSASCNFGEWTPGFSCITGACDLRMPGVQYTHSNGTILPTNSTVDNGVNVTITCQENFTLFQNDDREDSDQKAVQTCKNGQLSGVYKCIADENDDQWDYEDHDGDIENGDDDGDDKTTTESPEDESSATTTLEPNAETATEADYEEVYTYDEYEEVAPVDDKKCIEPNHGRAVEYLSYYKVICEDGFQLNVIEGDDIYKCTDGKYKSRNYKIEAKCTENSCQVTDEILWKMTVFTRKEGYEMTVSDPRTFDPNKKLYFNCKQEGQEPIKRRFNCSRGNWTAYDRGSWTMEIDNLEPSCREPKCDPKCEFGGTCVKDGRCDCVPGTTGKRCETPVCEPLCEENGGSCVGPGNCTCKEHRYGINCETVGCRRPDVAGNAQFRIGIKTSFKMGEVLADNDIVCPSGYMVSPKSLECQGNYKWSEHFKCIEEKIQYVLKVTIGTKTWSGSYGDLHVTIKAENGGIISRLSFEEPLYPGWEFTSETSTAVYLGKVGEIELEIGPHWNGNKNSDNLKIDSIQLTVQKADINEEYTFTNIGWIDLHQPKTVHPDAGCPPPPNVPLWAKKPIYKTGDVIQKGNVKCPYPSVDSVTCMKTGQWSMVLFCRKEATYTVTFKVGDYADRVFSAGTSDTLRISFHGNLGRTSTYVLSQGRIDKGSSHKQSVDAACIGQIHTVTLTKEKVRIWANNVQLDYIKLTVSHENKDEQYMFTDIGWIDYHKDLQPDPGCAPPTQNVHVLNPKHRYLTREKISANEVHCQGGFVKKAGQILCRKNGRWTDSICKEAEVHGCNYAFEKYRYGWLNAKGLKRGYKPKIVGDVEECKELCRQDNKCKAIATNGWEGRMACTLVNTNKEKYFVFNNTGGVLKVFLRKC